MTVTVDHNKNKRKGSWDSKMSVSTTVSTVPRRSRRTAGSASILSSDSDIRFTRRKLGQHCRCGCFVVAAFLAVLLLASVAVYLGYTYFMPEPPDEQVFRARFTVVEGDAYSPELADPSTEDFLHRAREYRERLNLVFRRSELRPAFVGTEVLALDGIEGRDLIVHFNLRFDPYYKQVSVSDLQSVLSKEINMAESRHLANLTIDPSSLEIQESSDMPTSSAPLSTSSEAPIRTTLPPPRRCQKVQLKYCKQLPYNGTSYPNVLGHKNLADVQEDLIVFRELVDAECYRMAYEFVCQLLQPACLVGEDEDEMVLPCRNFCTEFWTECGSRLPLRFRSILDCNNFPEFSGPGTCRPRPGCAAELQEHAQSTRMCDGVPDCADGSDETGCSYCSPGHMHCGKGRACVSRDRRCDGRKDCPDGSDERDCLGVSTSVSRLSQFPALTPHRARFSAAGFAVFTERGAHGKLCAEGLNTTGEEPHSGAGLIDNVAASLCRAMTYSKVVSSRVMADPERGVHYVRVEDPPHGAAMGAVRDISFVRTQCPSRRVLYVTCDKLECGLQSAHGDAAATHALGKMSALGDWPWHAALFRDAVHVCDGTLVSRDWLLTTSSCFQGQPKAEWRARLGVIRLNSQSPWQQERRVIGLVKSPVEGSTAVLIRLEQPVLFSDFVRPVCLPDAPPMRGAATLAGNNFTHCNTLGWARNREQLQRVQLRVSAMARCENTSIATVNSICTESAYQKQDCNEEELAGSPMVCLHSDGRRWALVGVSTWRIACSRPPQDGSQGGPGVERPRMYDKISSNAAWIQETIESSDSAITSDM